MQKQGALIFSCRSPAKQIAVASILHILRYRQACILRYIGLNNTNRRVWASPYLTIIACLQKYLNHYTRKALACLCHTITKLGFLLVNIYKFNKSLPIQTAEIVKTVSHMIANITIEEFIVNLWWSVFVFKAIVECITRSNTTKHF